MSRLKGPGTLTYGDGRVFHVEVDIEFPNGSGTVTSPSMVIIAERKRPGTLTCGHVQVPAIVTSGDVHGSGTITTLSPPTVQ